MIGIPRHRVAPTYDAAWAAAEAEAAAAAVAVAAGGGVHRRQFREEAGDAWGAQERAQEQAQEEVGQELAFMVNSTAYHSGIGIS